MVELLVIEFTRKVRTISNLTGNPVTQDLGSSSTSQKHYNTPSKELERVPCIALSLTSLRFKLFAWL